MSTRHAINEFRFRLIEAGERTLSIGCHRLPDLPPENKDRIKPQYCGFLVAEGTGSYEDWNGNVFPLKPGDFGQHIPGKWHLLKRDQDKPWLEWSVTCDDYLYQLLLGLNLVDPDRGVLYPKDGLQFVEQFRQLQDELCALPNRRLKRIVIGLQTLLNNILEASSCSDESTPYEQAIEEARDRLSRDFGCEVDLGELAARVNMSYPHFRRLFKTHTGQSPGAYRRQKRIQQAKAFLDQPNLSIGEVSELIGYADQFSFSKQFKKLTGLSPRDYRNRR